MSVRVEIVSGTIGSGFTTAVNDKINEVLSASKNAGDHTSTGLYYLSGDPWTSGSYEYQYIEIYVNDGFNFNPKGLSKNYRMQIGHVGVPTSSALSKEEYYTLYPSPYYTASHVMPIY